MGGVPGAWRRRSDVSRDVQDLIAVVAGRRSIVEELRSAPHELRQFVAGATRDFLGDAAAEEVIIDAIPDAVRFPDRLREALVRLHTIGRE